MPLIESEVKQGEAIRHGNLELIPVNRVLKIQSAGKHVGFIWNRPKAVVVRDEDGQEQVLPVTDVTRIAIWAMLAGGILGAILIGLLFRHQ
jgi:hypothetical protein